MSDKINDGGPAFPQRERVECGDKAVESIKHPGMSLRDWFAGQAMAALIGRNDFEYSTLKIDDGCAKATLRVAAYEISDHMLSIRESKLQ